MGAITFEDKKKFKPLQAADQLAYETHHLLSDSGPGRPILEKLMHAWPQLRGKYFDEDGLRSLIEETRRSGKI